MILYNSVIPSYDDLKKDKEKKGSNRPRYDEKLDANNPDNFNTESDREVVKK